MNKFRNFITLSNTRLILANKNLNCGTAVRFQHSVHSVDMAESLEVNHDKNKCEFFISMKKGDDTNRAILQYNWVDKNTIDMHHTGVPPEFRGKGVAKLLAKDALDFAVKEDLKYYLTCTYLQKYVSDNPLPEYTKQSLPLDS